MRPKKMNTTFLKALVLLLFAIVLFSWLLKPYSKRKVFYYFLELIGAGFLAIVGLVHIFEAKKWFEFM
jgi:hypothetical protein